MKTPGHYERKAEVREHGAIGCVLGMVSVGSMLGFALKGREAAGVVAYAVILALLFAGWVALLAAARRYRLKAITEEFYRTREEGPRAKEAYRRAITGPVSH